MARNHEKLFRGINRFLDWLGGIADRLVDYGDPPSGDTPQDTPEHREDRSDRVTTSGERFAAGRREGERWRIPQSRKVLDRITEIADEGQWGRALAYLRKVDPLVFEEILLTAFERQGYRIERNERYSGDGGIDGRVMIGGRFWLIQAKRYANAIRPEHVQEFADVCRRQERNGLFIHTGRTGPNSQRLFESAPDLHLLSGRKLIDFLVDRDGPGV
ncbi:restriction endonuclease [Thioalkalivibrio sp. ALE23]|uniref:restriction endonuclease n=1 Tax=Thioalkalivibrio sp. ALE23 TaxID=1265495 RepID=UPI00036604AD|nr:restriction endonuclease [Thioalkalivibrio sp. ALE23]